MALTIANVRPFNAGAKRGATFDITFDSSYAVDGESLSPSLIGFVSQIDTLDIEGQDGFSFEWDQTNNKLKVNDKPFVDTKLAVTDLDAAAATGVAVYVHIDETIEQGSNTGHLEFVSPTNADGSGTAYSGGPTYYIQDDDNAATGGVALYVDEDATLGSRLLANVGRDTYIEIAQGRKIKITHNATPGTPGVQVYFDEDAANSYERLLFVSPTNASGYDITQSEANSALDLSGLTVTATAIGV